MSPLSPLAPFVGRTAELAVLRAALADAVARRPRVVQIEGPAGMGKTALIERFLADPGGDLSPTVLRAGGDEAETLLAYGVVEQLARAGGLDPAAVTGPARPLDNPVTVGTRLLRLLDRDDEAGDEAVVVVVVDDAHWADRPSLSALLFALRRLVADQVLVLIGVRDAVTGLPEGLRRVVGGQAGAAIALPGLAEPELRDLAAQLGSPLSPVAARRLRDGTRGNPLHARALLAEFPAQSWGTGEWPLPSPRSFRLVVKDRWSGCSAAARDLVDAAAVLGMHSPLPQVASLAGLEEPLAPLDETTAAGLIAEPGPGTPVTVAFPHPLVRSAVHDSLGVARRSALHTAAAALVTEPAAVLRHRVAAATVPDAALAADLEAFARREAERQAWPAATASLVEAARQSPHAADRQRRVLEAVTWMLQNGDAASAAAHRGEIADFAPGAQRDSVLGALAMAAGRPAEAETLLRGAWSACREDTDPELRATIALQNAMHCYGRLDGAGTVTWCGRALEHTGPDTVTHWAASTYLAHGLGYAGRTAESFVAVAAADGPDYDWLEPRSARGTLRLVEDDLDGARADLAAAALAASELGVLNTAAFSLRVPGQGGVPGGRVGRRGRARRTRGGDQHRGGPRLHALDGRRHRRAGPRGPRRLGGRRAGDGGRARGRGRLRALGRGRRHVAGPDRRGHRRSRGGARRPRTGAPLPVPRRCGRARLLGVAGPVRGGARRRRAGRGGRRAARSRTRSAPPPGGGSRRSPGSRGPAAASRPRWGAPSRPRRRSRAHWTRWGAWRSRSTRRAPGWRRGSSCAGRGSGGGPPSC